MTNSKDNILIYKTTCTHWYRFFLILILCIDSICFCSDITDQSLWIVLIVRYFIGSLLHFWLCFLKSDWLLCGLGGCWYLLEFCFLFIHTYQDINKLISFHRVRNTLLLSYREYLFFRVYNVIWAYLSFSVFW